MERFVRGDVVIVQFPFSNLMQSKKRPALVLAANKHSDAIVCQITSNTREGVTIAHNDFVQGRLPRTSAARPDSLFTVHHKRIIRTAGHIHENTLNEVVYSVTRVLSGKS